LIKKTAIKLQIKRIRNIQQRYSLLGFNGKQEKMKIHANFEILSEGKALYLEPRENQFHGSFLGNLY